MIYYKYKALGIETSHANTSVHNLLPHANYQRSLYRDQIGGIEIRTEACRHFVIVEVESFKARS